MCEECFGVVYEKKPKTTSYANFLRQVLVAEVWSERVAVLAVKHGVTMIHDEILFESAEQFEAFNRDLAGLELA